MLEIKVPAQVEHLDEVLGFVNAALSNAEADAKQRNNINIAVEEIFVNIANYAYPSGDGDVVMSVLTSPDNLIIDFKDSGIPYDPLSRSDPDTTLTLDEREIGGLGIFMVKKMMDTVSYRYEDGCNILTISKQWT